jgi:hypothetical protein
MALTKEELIGSLQNEIRILVHLCGKVTPEAVDYRPTPKQRSTIELLRYLTVMGPILVPACQTGVFDGAAWEAKMKEADAMDLGAVVKSIESQSAFYADSVGPMADADFAKRIELFGLAGSTGSMLVNMVLSGHAAYRTQLFLYLKSAGREELNTMNLWAGIDAPMG